MTEAWLIYDGHCPFCSAYVKYVRVREHVRLHLVNAREGDPLVEDVLDRGFDLDKGMVLKMGEHFYHGAGCINVLVVLSSSVGVFNRVNALIFGSPTLSRVLYPVLRSGRNSVLALLGRTKIGCSASEHQSGGRVSPYHK